MMGSANPVALMILITEVLCRQSCPRNCAYNRCYDKNTCIQCVDGFYKGNRYDQRRYPVKNDCSLKCSSSNCEACSSYNNCTKCRAGYCNKGDERNCQNRCSQNCETCTSCEVCTKCKQWYYGKTCRSFCGHGCLNGNCDIHNGRCNCGKNFRGTKCDACVVGKYGNWCELDCPKGCVRNHCDKNNGICTYGCKIGYKNLSCNTCNDGFYGDKCDACPRNCLKCKSARLCYLCNKGFWGNKCDSNCPKTCISCVSENRCQTCVVGFYGRNCSSRCPINCADNICRKGNGECSGCKFGFWGEHCNTLCNLGCSQNKCNSQNGRCFGCKSNFTGLNCESCVDGFYGQECKVCPSNCSECLPGKYRNRCNVPCSKSCVNTSCNWLSGYCTFGCNDGFEGLQCTQESAENGNTFRLAGIVGGSLMAIILGTIVIVVYMRHRKSTHTRREVEMTEMNRNTNNELQDVTNKREDDRNIYEKENATPGFSTSLKGTRQVTEISAHGKSIAADKSRIYINECHISGRHPHAVAAEYENLRESTKDSNTYDLLQL